MEIPDKYIKMPGASEDALPEMLNELTDEEINELLILLLSVRNRDCKLEIEFINRSGSGK